MMSSLDFTAPLQQSTTMGEQTKKSLSGTKFRKMLRGGDDIPEWFAFKSVVDVLREAN